MSGEFAIEARGLTKRFGDRLALCGVDLEAEPGDVLGLIGPNGAGKTTTIRILATLLRPDAGTARVVGFDVVDEVAALRASKGASKALAEIVGQSMEALRSFRAEQASPRSTSSRFWAIRRWMAWMRWRGRWMAAHSMARRIKGWMG